MSSLFRKGKKGPPKLPKPRKNNKMSQSSGSEDGHEYVEPDEIEALTLQKVCTAMHDFFLRDTAVQ